MRQVPVFLYGLGLMEALALQKQILGKILGADTKEDFVFLMRVYLDISAVIVNKLQGECPDEQDD